MNLDTK